MARKMVWPHGQPPAAVVVQAQLAVSLQLPLPERLRRCDLGLSASLLCWAPELHWLSSFEQ